MINSLTIKRILGRAGRLRHKRGPRRVVLLYHAVGAGPDACTAGCFSDQIAWLAKNAQVLHLEDLLSGRGDGPLQVAVTFDDGYASVAQVAAPIMARHNIPSTIYLTASCIASREADRRESDPSIGHLAGEKFMLWDEVRALHDAGWQIGSHGLDHVDMTSLNASELNDQLRGARALIEQELGVPCPAFAYPWGRNSWRTRAAAASAGYSHAAGTIHGPLYVDAPRLAFPRINIHRDYALDDVANMLRGDWDCLGLVQAMRLRRYARS